MEITIDLMQFMLILLIMAGVAACIFLIILFARLIGTSKRASKLLDQIDAPLTSTLGQLPDLIKKVDGISDNVAVLTVSINESVPSIMKDAQAIAGLARSGVEAVGGAAKSVGESVSSFFQPAESSKTDSFGAIVNIISQIVGVVSYFTTQKKDKAHPKCHNHHNR
ncbi:MAG: hypothetical protein WCY62_02615 [Clostridia bacterium]